MSVDVTVHGADQLTRTLHAAATDLSDLSVTHGRAGDTVLAGARARTPVRTGRLVASLVVTTAANGVTVSAGAPYAAAVHWGSPGHRAQPFLLEGAAATEATWVGHYEDAVAAAVNGVQGA